MMREDSEMVKIDNVLYMVGYDDCIAGHSERDGITLAVYSISKLIEAHIKEGMSQEEAIEFIEYNQSGSYMGKGTPLFLDDTY